MTAESWRDVPLDVDGVLTLDMHREACQRGPFCPICCGDEDAAESEVH